jgi:hypothetical protein
MIKERDPTKDPEFRKVVQTFLRTPPKPHKPVKIKARKRRTPEGKKASKV